MAEMTCTMSTGETLTMASNYSNFHGMQSLTPLRALIGFCRVPKEGRFELVPCLLSAIGFRVSSRGLGLN